MILNLGLGAPGFRSNSNISLESIPSPIHYLLEQLCIKAIYTYIFFPSKV